MKNCIVRTHQTPKKPERVDTLVPNMDMVMASFAEDNIVHDDFETFFRSAMNSLQFLIETVNFNEMRPQNHNILYQHNESEFGEVHVECGWQQRHIDDILDEFMDVRLDNFLSLLNGGLVFNEEAVDEIKNIINILTNHTSRCKKCIKKIFVDNCEMVRVTKKSMEVKN